MKWWNPSLERQARRARWVVDLLTKCTHWNRDLFETEGPFNGK